MVVKHPLWRDMIYMDGINMRIVNLSTRFIVVHSFFGYRVLLVSARFDPGGTENLTKTSRTFPTFWRRIERWRRSVQIPFEAVFTFKRNAFCRHLFIDSFTFIAFLRMPWFPVRRGCAWASLCLWTESGEIRGLICHVKRRRCVDSRIILSVDHTGIRGNDATLVVYR